MALQRTGSTHRRKMSIVMLEAAQDFFPTQCSADSDRDSPLSLNGTIEGNNRKRKLIPTPQNLLEVRHGDRYKLPGNKIQQWILVEKLVPQNQSPDSGIESPVEDSPTPKDGPMQVVGFIPVSCLMPDNKKILRQSLMTVIEPDANPVAKNESNMAVMKLAKTEQQLHEALERNHSLHLKYKEDTTKASQSMHSLLEQLVEKGEQLDEARRECEQIKSKLKQEAEYSAELRQRLKEFESEDKCSCGKRRTSKKSNASMNATMNGMHESSDDEDLDFDVAMIERQLRKKSLTPLADLMLSCALCGTKIRIEELESHSAACSSEYSAKKKKDEQSGGSPSHEGLMLVATVTQAKFNEENEDDPSTPLRLICKTTIPQYKKPLCVSERMAEDFVWFREALESYHRDRIIPPLSLKNSLQGNLREIQRFLSRLCSHKVLKTDSLVRSFLTASSKELVKVKKTFKKTMEKMEPMASQRPAVEITDENGILFRTQQYTCQLIENLTALVEFLHNAESVPTNVGLSSCFQCLSDGEVNSTYLKTTAKALGQVVAQLENQKNISYNEGGLVEDLESILEYVICCREFLERVETSINTFLYWEEEIKVIEGMKNEGLVTGVNKNGLTHKWAEATSKSRQAKEQLERMCRELSHELSEFDFRKEQEIKHIFIEFSEAKSQHLEKLQSKWVGMRMMVDTDIKPTIRAIQFS